MNYTFRLATIADQPQIWDIIQKAIARRKSEGSKQWQDGYPNQQIIISDIAKSGGYVLTQDEIVLGYIAVFFNDEPEYIKIIGKWLTNDKFLVIHRLAIAEEYLGKGLAKLIFTHIQDLALKNNIFSIKADTNFDNQPMLKIFSDLGFFYCGEVTFRGNSRKAFEKVLSKL